MLLVAVEGLSYNEAGEPPGVPIGAVMSPMSHARHAIGALIGKRCDRKMKTTSTGSATGDHERLVERHEDIPKGSPRSAGYGI